MQQENINATKIETRQSQRVNISRQTQFAI